MKIFFINTFILLSLIFLSCSQKKENKQNLHYSISLGTFQNYNQAAEFRFQFTNEIRAKIRYELIGSKKYKVLIGNFKNSYEAGEEAFKLFLEKKINKYEIVKDGQDVLDEFINIPFVSFYLGKSSLFNYNLKTKVKELLLNFQNKDVATINLTKFSDRIFILTFEKQPNEKQLKNLELLLYNRNNEDIKKLLSLNNINSAYTYCDYPDSFKTNFIKIDDKNPRKIFQTIYSWDSEGNEKKIVNKKYDLLIDGYPKINNKRIEYFSPNNKYQIKIKNDDIYKNIYLYDYENKSETFIAFTSNTIYDIKWSKNNKYIFVITKSENKKSKKDELFIINSFNKTVIKKNEGFGFNNLLVRGNFLFFDVILNNINSIVVYDILNQSEYDIINLYGGCSLNTYPKDIK